MIAARTQPARDRRQRPSRGWRLQAAVAIYTVAAIALVPAFLWLSPASHWGHWVLLAALAFVAVFASASAVTLNVSAPGRLDPTVTIALLALLVGGPVPALIVACSGEIVPAVIGRLRPVRTLAFTSTLVSVAAGVFTAGSVLRLTTDGSLGHTAPMLFLAGFAGITVNFIVARIPYAVIWRGQPLARVVPEFTDALPAILAMLLLAVVTGLAIAAVGIWGLALVAPVAVLPSFTAAVRAWSFRTLSRPRVAALYAGSIAAAMGMGGRERRAAAEATQVALNGGPAVGVDHRVRVIAWHADERWDGGGRPAGLAGRHIPRASRVVAVAAEWARLTAADGADLTHEQALLDLELRSGSEFDPDVVRAAAELIAEERAIADVRGRALPVLHTLPLPAVARRAIGRALGSCVTTA